MPSDKASNEASQYFMSYRLIQRNKIRPSQAGNYHSVVLGSAWVCQRIVQQDVWTFRGGVRVGRRERTMPTQKSINPTGLTTDRRPYVNLKVIIALCTVSMCSVNSATPCLQRHISSLLQGGYSFTVSWPWVHGVKHDAAHQSISVFVLQ